MAFHGIAIELNLKSAFSIGIMVSGRTAGPVFSHIPIYSSSVHHLIEKQISHIAYSTDVPPFLRYNG